SEVVFDARLNCDSLAKARALKSVPFTPEVTGEVEVRHLSEPRLLCRMPRSAKQIQFKSLEIQPLAVISNEEQPIRDILTREDYGRADKIVEQSASDIDVQSWSKKLDEALKFNWLDEEACWGRRREGCSELAMTYCAPPL
ncbi:MAG: hypothetical protein WBB85_12145, partial [Albidovulum sp.]|uniref:hypothetical protein n=1 Tax=Albidovulum sp. TaxID=1872424 RepID=UPI003C916DEE